MPLSSLRGDLFFFSPHPAVPRQFSASWWEQEPVHVGTSKSWGLTDVEMIWAPFGGDLMVSHQDGCL